MNSTDTPTKCPNCKETTKECACMRNKCIKCGQPVGNITFTVCDDCWDLDKNNMKNIITQNGCWNCKFVFLHSQQDEWDVWYCNHTNDRPRSGDCGYKTHEECFIHDENGKDVSPEECYKRSQAWSDWVEGKEVKPYQKCDYWKET